MRVFDVSPGGTRLAIGNGNVETNNNEERTDMLNWTITFLIVALIAGLLGFTGIAGAAMGIAKIIFVIFLVLFLVTLVMRLAPK